MRISSTTFQDDAIAQIDSLQAQIARTQQQLSTGQKIQSAADDPAGVAQVNQLNVEISASTQYVTNSNTAQTNLKLEGQALSDALGIAQNASTLAVQANNAALNAEQRQNIATELQQDLQSLVAIANRTDGNGNFLFGGYANTSTPFSQSGNTVTYNGANAVSQVQISANQSISVGDSGATAFLNIPAGNGTFTVSAASANTGSAAITSTSLANPAQWVPGTYTLSFTSPSDYQITNGSGSVVSSGTYTSGDTISFNGAHLTLAGTPAAGDQFTIAPAGATSAFGALSNLITTLNSTTLNNGQLTTQISAAVQQIGNTITHLSNVSASVGSRLNAITAVQSAAQSIQTTLQANISTLSSTDYAAATGQLTSQELALQAAQESYASIAKLSLFQFLS
jgi:flagellar hook-associated protein 3 FlgL